MRPTHTVNKLNSKMGTFGMGAARWMLGWWDIVYFGAQAMVIALSPSSYRAHTAGIVARHIYLSVGSILPWYSVLAAVVSLVITRIVVVTALSYGLSQYALEMVVRVLVLELLPISAAVFVALRYMAPISSDVAAMQRESQLASWRDDQTVLRDELMPRVLAGVVSVLTLTAVSAVLALLIAYVVVYGLSPWGFDAYTRMVGRVFGPAIALGFAVKSLLFSLAVGVIPIAASMLNESMADTSKEKVRAARVGLNLAGISESSMVRLFLVIFMIEAATLTIRYF
jgi:phospholipid/cholesterol/gamma-HCH transport system permease protein